MDKLSEELLDQIVSESATSLPNTHQRDYNTLLCLSLVTHQLHRITEPHLYHSVVSKSYGNALLRTLESRLALGHYVNELRFLEDSNLTDGIKLFPLLPNLRELEINMDAIPLTSLTTILKVVSIDKLRLNCVQASQCDDWDVHRWSYINENIKTLDISFVDPDGPWEECDDISRLATVLPNLSCLKIHNIEADGAWSSMNAPVFRCIVNAFRSAFQKRLLNFEFQYNDSNHASNHVGHEGVSDSFDVRGILLRSNIEHIKTETNCLLRTHPPHARSLAIAPICLPTTLRKLYLRHEVLRDRMASDRENLIYSEESQCLAQLLTALGKKGKFPVLQKVTLIIFLPAWYAEIASRIVRRYARQNSVLYLNFS